MFGGNDHIQELDITTRNKHPFNIFHTLKPFLCHLNLAYTRNDRVSREMSGIDVVYRIKVDTDPDTFSEVSPVSAGIISDEIIVKNSP